MSGDGNPFRLLNPAEPGYLYSAADRRPAASAKDLILAARKAAPYAEIARRTGASRSYVSRVLGSR